MLIPAEETLKSVRTENPWWSGKGVSKRFAELPARAYLKPFADLVTNLSINRAVVLMGPRRVGKTVMAQQLVKRLLDDGFPAKNIMFVSIDTPIYTGQSLDSFVRLHAEENELDDSDQRYIIFDEIQYLKDWERHLKVLVDRNPHIRFVASGSAAAALKRASTESGAGRFTDFLLPPLTFAEYLNFVGKNNLVQAPEERGFYKSDSIDALNAEFCNYINFGGYPEAVMSEVIRADAARFIKNDIIEKVLLRDLPQLYGIKDIQELNNLFSVLAYISGQETSLEKLSQNSGISKPTISKYMEYLEAAFLIFRIKRVDQTSKRLLRERAFKVYLTNPSMRSALFSPVGSDDDGFGHLVETAVMSQWQHGTNLGDLYYARWKRSGRSKVDHGDHAEIDIVCLGTDHRPRWVVEVKWSDSEHHKAAAWAAIDEMARSNPELVGAFTTKSQWGVREVDGIEFDILPSATYAYTIGLNTQSARALSRSREEKFRASKSDID
jgi:hypothetical protein